MLAAPLLLLPGWALAGNALNPRTPVVWEDVPCLQRVDRSEDPIMHLPYAIPREDTDRTADEVDDSRTHQFFAFCRPRHPQDPLPNWITWADVEAATATGLLGSATEVDDTDVLETSTAWEDCWFRITEDDARRPILFEVAESGVDWDTSTVPPGPYTVAGFTHEPIFNLWITRPGVVLVHDGAPEALGPFGAVTTEEAIVEQGTTVTIEGCIDADPETRLTAWISGTQGANAPGWQPTWVAFAEDHPIDGDIFSVDLLTPAELAGQSSMIRIDFEDPTGRTYTTYMQDRIIILAGTDPGCEPPDCEDGSTGGDPVDATTTDDGTSPADEDAGCGCTSSPRGASLLALMVLFARPRRRACAACSTGRGPQPRCAADTARVTVTGADDLGVDAVGEDVSAEQAGHPSV
jgi:hypothetical protein